MAKHCDGPSERPLIWPVFTSPIIFQGPSPLTTQPSIDEVSKAGKLQRANISAPNTRPYASLNAMDCVGRDVKLSRAIANAPSHDPSTRVIEN
ncbi:unannotated protein [freshwater metagenome]|uniref:Unannotated protein n=1 Tax=freshwater metagenome TaxID=449393 RepID=A0A6J7SF30_9ZZZZ